MRRIWQAKKAKSAIKRQIRAITPFKVIQGHRVGTNRKPICDFLLVIIELLSLAGTAEALQAKIDRKSAISLQRGHINPTFRVEGDVPHQ